MIPAFFWGVTLSNLIASGLAVFFVLHTRRDAVARARRLARITVQREVLPRLNRLDARAMLLEEIEYRRAGPRIVAGTEKPDEATA